MLKPDSQVSRIGTVRRVALELLGPCRKSEAPAKAKRKETKEKDDRLQLHSYAAKALVVQRFR